MGKDMIARNDGQDESDGDFGALDIQVLSGLDLSADNVIPPILGVGAAAISSLLVRKFVAHELVQNWADAIGGVIGAALCMPIKYWKGDEAMSSAMVSSLAYGVVTTAVKKLGPMLGIGYLVPQMSGLAIERMGYLPQIPTMSAQQASIPREVRASADISAFGRP
jgi:CBS-domain-containing membrane protein